MREIKFRGKCIKDNKWVYGYYAHHNDYFRHRETHGIYTDYADSMPESDGYSFYPDFDAVDPETVGQFTGLLDKNGEEIYEGDILRIYYHGLNKVFGVVRYAESRFYIEDEFKNELTAKAPMTNMFLRYQFEIVGNIQDDPELLKGGEK